MSLILVNIKDIYIPRPEPLNYPGAVGVIIRLLFFVLYPEVFKHGEKILIYILIAVAVWRQLNPPLKAGKLTLVVPGIIP